MVFMLLKSLREYKWQAIITSILVIFEVVLEVFIPFATANLIDGITQGFPISEIVGRGLILAAMAILSLIVGALAGITCSVASAGFAKNLRKDMFYNVQTFSFATMDKFSVPSLVTRMTTDVTNTQLSFMMIIRMAVRAPMIIVFSMIMAYIMAGDLALVYVYVSVPLALVIIILLKLGIPIYRRVFKHYDSLNESVQENVENMRVVKSFVREKFEIKKFDKAATDLQKEYTKAERLLALMNPCSYICTSLIFVIMIYLSSKTIIQSQGTVMNVGQFSTLFVYGFMILMSLVMFSMVFAMIAMSIESMRRIEEVLSARTTIHDSKNPIYEVEDGSVSFKGVSFSYSEDQEVPSLHNITLDIKSGETIGIIGGTGSSKSTLVQLIPRLYDVSSGSVEVAGKDVRNYDVKTLRDAISMVLQKNVLFSGTIAENLRWGNEDASDEELWDACNLAQATEFVEKLPEGLNTYIEQGGTNVSGGQKQRLCIARALLKKPKIIIFDDSTSAVDTKTDKKIRDGLATYLPDTTKIIIAQRTSSVETADRIIVLDGGTVADIGTHDELLSREGIYKEVYISQNKKSHDDRMERNQKKARPSAQKAVRYPAHKKTGETRSQDTDTSGKEA